MTPWTNVVISATFICLDIQIFFAIIFLKIYFQMAHTGVKCIISVTEIIHLFMISSKGFSTNQLSIVNLLAHLAIPINFSEQIIFLEKIKTEKEFKKKSFQWFFLINKFLKINNYITTEINIREFKYELNFNFNYY